MINFSTWVQTDQTEPVQYKHCTTYTKTTYPVLSPKNGTETCVIELDKSTKMGQLGYDKFEIANGKISIFRGKQGIPLVPGKQLIKQIAEHALKQYGISEVCKIIPKC